MSYAGRVNGVEGPCRGEGVRCTNRAASSARTAAGKGAERTRHDRHVAVPVVITDPDDPRVADFRDLTAGDPPAGRPRRPGTAIVEGPPHRQRVLASPDPVR